MFSLVSSLFQNIIQKVKSGNFHEKYFCAVAAIVNDLKVLYVAENVADKESPKTVRNTSVGRGYGRD